MVIQCDGTSTTTRNKTKKPILYHNFFNSNILEKSVSRINDIISVFCSYSQSLHNMPLPFDVVARRRELRERYPTLSAEDITALTVAEQEEAEATNATSKPSVSTNKKKTVPSKPPQKLKRVQSLKYSSYFLCTHAN